MLRPTLLVLAAVAFATLTACAHKPLLSTTTQLAKVNFDPRFATQPKRFWRLAVKWDPYLLDDKKAMVTKEFQLFVREMPELKRLEDEIRSRGGDARYLRWLENELAPLGNWERRIQGRVTRLPSQTVVVLAFKSDKEVDQAGYLTANPIHFPDPLLEATERGCRPIDWEVLPVDDSVGVELVFVSRHENPAAPKWDSVEREAGGFGWKAWSQVQGKLAIYDAAIFVKNNISRCPLPPKVSEEYKLFQKTLASAKGVDW